MTAAFADYGLPLRGPLAADEVMEGSTMRRYRLIEWKNEEIYFSNGPQSGSFVVGVDTTVGDEGPSFRRVDVTGLDLSIVIGSEVVSCRDRLPQITADWLATPGNLQLLARRVEWAEERDPTWKLDRPGFDGRRGVRRRNID